MREPEGLGAAEAAVVSRILQDPEAAKVVDLGRRFCRIVRSCCGQQPSGKTDVTAFDEWLGDAQTCGVRVVESFAGSLGQDGGAVRSTLTLRWSSGQAEWQITRVKLLKRAMYGRGNLDLLDDGSFSQHNPPNLAKSQFAGSGSSASLDFGDRDAGSPPAPTKSHALAVAFRL